MGKTKELFEELNYQHILGEEHRAYIHWMEQEQYYRYQPSSERKNKE
jgi:hypothetical protein